MAYAFSRIVPILFRILSWPKINYPHACAQPLSRGFTAAGTTSIGAAEGPGGARTQFYNSRCDLQSTHASVAARIIVEWFSWLLQVIVYLYHVISAMGPRIRVAIKTGDFRNVRIRGLNLRLKDWSTNDAAKNTFNTIGREIPFGTKRVALPVAIPLERIKGSLKLAETTGLGKFTINDALTSSLLRAFDRVRSGDVDLKMGQLEECLAYPAYLLPHVEAMRKTLRSRNAPEVPMLSGWPFCLTVSLRATTPTEMDNMLIPVMIRLAGVLKDRKEKPHDTLWRTKLAMDEMKHEALPIVIGNDLVLLSYFLPVSFFGPLCTAMGDQCETVFTNVVGPSGMGVLKGRRITDLVFWPPVRGQLTSAVAAMSYCGNLKVQSIADAEMCKDWLICGECRARQKPAEKELPRTAHVSADSETEEKRTCDGRCSTWGGEMLTRLIMDELLLLGSDIVALSDALNTDDKNNKVFPGQLSC
eukprot:Selendium_serpulae@DN6073_c0_g1_i2.p1